MNEKSLDAATIDAIYRAQQAAKDAEAAERLRAAQALPERPEMTAIDIEHADAGELRFVLEVVIKNLRGPEGKPSSRARALAVTKLQEARFWLGEEMYAE